MYCTTTYLALAYHYVTKIRKSRGFEYHPLFSYHNSFSKQSNKWTQSNGFDSSLKKNQNQIRMRMMILFSPQLVCGQEYQDLSLCGWVISVCGVDEARGYTFFCVELYVATRLISHGMTISSYFRFPLSCFFEEDFNPLCLF